MSHVVPIPKSEEYTSPSNYRPISLLSILSKVLEHHVHYIISEHLSLTNPLAANQWGFRARRSTTLALLNVTNDWMHNLDSELETCAVFFDFRKAFDSVPHCKLISKLQSFQLNPALVRWIYNYLSGYFQRVVFDEAISQATPVISGVPQGSVLGPLLFLLYIDSLSYLQLSHGTKMVLYADDVLIYRCIHYLHDYNILQNDVNQIFSWSLTNCLEFNPTKCKQMVFFRKQISIPYFPLQLGDNILERVYTL